jgi:hypothetical protein
MPFNEKTSPARRATKTGRKNHVGAHRDDECAKDADIDVLAERLAHQNQGDCEQA